MTDEPIVDLVAAGRPAVLIVEDDPSVRGLLKTLLEAEGYRVATASDGLAGLLAAEATPPALILLDLVMPDFGGLRVLEALHANPAVSRVPVVVVTGQLEAVPALERRLGADRVFIKPFGVVELLDRVAALTGKASS